MSGRKRGHQPIYTTAGEDRHMRRAGDYGGRVSAVPKPDSESQPSTGWWPRLVPGPVTVVLAATAAVLVAVALLQPPGWLLAVLCLLAALALGAVAAVARSLTLAVSAAVLAATAVVGASGLALGARADASGGAAYDFPLVVGLPLPQAKALFQRHGPVRFMIQRAPYGTRGTVLRATGYAPDGSYAPGSTITLLVGSRAPKTASSSGG
jgi:hypothetical protein